MYGTLAAWRTYATERGDNAPTAAPDTLATAALVRASDYIQYSYVARFVSPYGETSTGVDIAAYEAANLELATPGFFSTTYTPSQQKVLTEVKGIKWTPVGDASGPASVAPVSTTVDAILAPYLPVIGLAPFIKTLGAQV